MATQEAVEADSYWSTQLKKFYDLTLECVNCGMIYRESENIGRWKCSQHVQFPEINRGEIWTCCKRKSKGRPWPINYGCVKSDHTVLNCPYDESHDIPLPAYIARKMGIETYLPSVIKVGSEFDFENYKDEKDKVMTKKNYVKIRRYDIQSVIKKT